MDGWATDVFTANAKSCYLANDLEMLGCCGTGCPLTIVHPVSVYWAEDFRRKSYAGCREGESPFKLFRICLLLKYEFHIVFFIYLSPPISPFRVAFELNPSHTNLQPPNVLPYRTKNS
jgi:hypothetical protein